MSARGLAAQVQPGSTVRWDRLERAAFAGQPSVLGEEGPKKKVRKNNWHLVWGIPLLILYLFCYTAPIWGTAAISVSRFQTYRQDTEETIPLTGTLFIFALALLVVSMVHWFVTGRRRNGFYQVQAALAFTLGGLSAAAVRMHGLSDSVEGWETWIVPIMATVVLGLIFSILLLVERLGESRRSNPPEPGDVALPANKIQVLKQRRERVANLTAPEQAAIRSDIESAIGDLERRGLISAAEADRARGAELGSLALLMPRTR